MNKKAIALAVAGALGAASSADAVVVNLNHLSTTSDSPNGPGTQIISGNGTTATWTFDTVTGIVSSSGLYVEQTQVNPLLPGSFYTRSIADLTLGGGSNATATSYSCADGSIANVFSASFCGNYNYGSNFTNESTMSYGPGTAASRTLGGDDMALAPLFNGDSFQQLSQYDGMVNTWNGSTTPGTTLVLSNVVSAVGGSQLTFEIAAAVPVPASVWLFGSALGLLGFSRNRKLRSRR